MINLGVGYIMLGQEHRNPPIDLNASIKVMHTAAIIEPRAAP
jgi:hypothetical protein